MTTDRVGQLRAELEAVFGDAEYPVEEPMGLMSVLPDGPGTTFEADDISVGVMDFGSEYAEYQDYPYESSEALINDLMTGFKKEGLFD